MQNVTAVPKTSAQTSRGGPFAHRFPLLRTHGEIPGAILHVDSVAADSQHRRRYVICRAVDAAYARDALVLQGSIERKSKFEIMSSGK